MWEMLIMEKNQRRIEFDAQTQLIFSNSSEMWFQTCWPPCFPSGCSGQKVHMYVTEYAEVTFCSSASFPDCAFRHKKSGVIRIQKATNCDCLSSILERNFQPVLGGNPKADQLLLDCITEVFYSSWNIWNSIECFIRGYLLEQSSFSRLPTILYALLSLQICDLDVVARQELLCKPYWRRDFGFLLPPPRAYLFYASAVWFKKGQRLLASYVKHISPILLACLISAAFYSGQHFFFKKSVWKCSWLFPQVQTPVEYECRRNNDLTAASST